MNYGSHRIIPNGRKWISADRFQVGLGSLPPSNGLLESMEIGRITGNRGPRRNRAQARHPRLAQMRTCRSLVSIGSSVTPFLENSWTIRTTRSNPYLRTFNLT